jgi:hypothetical protein
MFCVAIICSAMYIVMRAQVKKTAKATDVLAE